MLVLPVAPSLTLDKLKECSRLWKKDNSGGELSSFLLALVVYQFSVTDGTSSFCLNTLDYLWMTGQLRREYCGWPSLKSVTLIKSCREMSAWQSTWNNQGPDFDPTVTYLQFNSIVSSKIKSPCLQNRKILDSSQYGKCKEKLSPLYPQLLNTSIILADGRFAQKKSKSEIWPISGRTMTMETPPTGRYTYRFAKTNKAVCRVSWTALIEYVLSHVGTQVHVQQLSSKRD